MKIDDFWWNLNLKKHQKIMKKRCFLHIFIIFWRYFIARFSMKFHKIWRIIWNLNLKKRHFSSKKWCFLWFISSLFFIIFMNYFMKFIIYRIKIIKIRWKSSIFCYFFMFFAQKSDVFYKILWFFMGIYLANFHEKSWNIAD